MMKQRIVFLLALTYLSLGSWASEAHANIIIKVRALNPLETKEVAAIRYPLPEEIVPDDILTKRIKYSLPQEEEEEERIKTFNVEYVDGERRYFIIDEVVLGPKEVVTLEAHVKDIWIIGQDRLNEIRQTVEDLISQFSPAPEVPSKEEPGEEKEPSEEELEPVEDAPDETVMILKEGIFNQLDQIAASQAKSSVLLVGVEKHMEIYYGNMEALGQVRADVEMLRYMLEPEEEETEETGEDGGQEPEELTEEVEILEEFVLPMDSDDSADQGEPLEEPDIDIVK